MKEDQEKKLDDFIRKVVQEGGHDEPSKEFTDTVMERIRKAKEAKLNISYSPLITKKVWFLLSVLVVGAIVFVLTSDQQLVMGSRLLPYAEYFSGLGSIELWGDLSINELGSIKIHKTVIYAVLMLPVFFFIQIFYLQRRQAI